MRFPGLSLEDDVPDHSVLSYFRTLLTTARAWYDLLKQINQQIHALTVIAGCHVVANITHSPSKLKTKSSYEVISDRKKLNDEPSAQVVMK